MNRFQIFTQKKKLDVDFVEDETDSSDFETKKPMNHILFSPTKFDFKQPEQLLQEQSQDQKTYLQVQYSQDDEIIHDNEQYQDSKIYMPEAQKVLEESKLPKTIIANPDIIKKIIGIRQRHGRVQVQQIFKIIKYLNEKFSGTRTWKDSALLDQKGYSSDIMRFNQFLEQRLYSALYSSAILDQQLIHYTRRHKITSGALQNVEEVMYVGHEYPKRYSVFDKKIQKRVCKQLDQISGEESILDYHSLVLNEFLNQAILILSCDRKRMIYSQPIEKVEVEHPKDLAIYLYDQLKQIIKE